MTTRRIAKTISDVKELLGDYDVSLILHETFIFLVFPDMEKYQSRVKGSHVPANKPDQGRQFTENVRCTLRSLTDSPQFWRVTTVADQIDRFARFHDGANHGIVKVTKTKSEPLTIIFDSTESANKFHTYMLETD